MQAQVPTYAGPVWVLRFDKRILISSSSHKIKSISKLNQPALLCAEWKNGRKFIVQFRMDSTSSQSTVAIGFQYCISSHRSTPSLHVVLVRTITSDSPLFRQHVWRASSRIPLTCLFARYCLSCWQRGKQELNRCKWFPYLIYTCCRWMEQTKADGE